MKANEPIVVYLLAALVMVVMIAIVAPIIGDYLLKAFRTFERMWNDKKDDF